MVVRDAKRQTKTNKATSERRRLREIASNCRSHVVREVVKNRKRVRIQVLVNKFKRTKSAIVNDLSKYYWPEGFPIGIQKGHLVYDDTRLTTEGRRRHERHKAKARIGQLGATIIVGPERENSSRESLLKLLQENPQTRGMSSKLIEKFAAYYFKAHRMAILDSGTTTLEIAGSLTDVVTPAPKRHLNFLRVLTNGRRVADKLDAPDATHGIILLGGSLRRDTEAVAGLLAVRCLDAWLVNTADSAIADIAIIGTTSVNEAFDFFSDSEIESEMKSRLLNSARIRCICADSSKLMRRGGGSWAFCGFSNSMIDMILTDPGIHVEQQNAHLENGRQALLKAAQKAEIFIAPAKLS
jgi:DeoR/GlpR family transcriptional regulator of sugar metabolism